MTTAAVSARALLLLIWIALLASCCARPREEGETSSILHADNELRGSQTDERRLQENHADREDTGEDMEKDRKQQMDNKEVVANDDEIIKNMGVNDDLPGGKEAETEDRIFKKEEENDGTVEDLARYLKKVAEKRQKLDGSERRPNDGKTSDRSGYFGKEDVRRPHTHIKSGDSEKEKQQRRPLAGKNDMNAASDMSKRRPQTHEEKKRGSRSQSGKLRVHTNEKAGEKVEYAKEETEIGAQDGDSKKDAKAASEMSERRPPTGQEKKDFEKERESRSRKSSVPTNDESANKEEYVKEEKKVEAQGGESQKDMNAAREMSKRRPHRGGEKKDFEKEMQSRSKSGKARMPTNDESEEYVKEEKIKAQGGESQKDMNVDREMSKRRPHRGEEKKDFKKEMASRSQSGKPRMPTNDESADKEKYVKEEKEVEAQREMQNRSQSGKARMPTNDESADKEEYVKEEKIKAQGGESQTNMNPAREMSKRRPHRGEEKKDFKKEMQSRSKSGKARMPTNDESEEYVKEEKIKAQGGESQTNMNAAREMSKRRPLRGGEKKDFEKEMQSRSRSGKARMPTNDESEEYVKEEKIKAQGGESQKNMNAAREMSKRRPHRGEEKKDFKKEMASRSQSGKPRMHTNEKSNGRIEKDGKRRRQTDDFLSTKNREFGHHKQQMSKQDIEEKQRRGRKVPNEWRRHTKEKVSKREDGEILQDVMNDKKVKELEETRRQTPDSKSKANEVSKEKTSERIEKNRRQGRQTDDILSARNPEFGHHKPQMSKQDVEVKQRDIRRRYTKEKVGKEEGDATKVAEKHAKDGEIPQHIMNDKKLKKHLEKETGRQTPGPKLNANEVSREKTSERIEKDERQGRQTDDFVSTRNRDFGHHKQQISKQDAEEKQRRGRKVPKEWRRHTREKVGEREKHADKETEAHAKDGEILQDVMKEKKLEKNLEIEMGRQTPEPKSKANEVSKEKAGERIEKDEMQRRQTDDFVSARNRIFGHHKQHTSRQDAEAKQRDVRKASDERRWHTKDSEILQDVMKEKKLEKNLEKETGRQTPEPGSKENGVNREKASERIGKDQMRRRQTDDFLSARNHEFGHHEQQMSKLDVGAKQRNRPNERKRHTKENVGMDEGGAMKREILQEVMNDKKLKKLEKERGRQTPEPKSDANDVSKERARGRIGKERRHRSAENHEIGDRKQRMEKSAERARVRGDRNAKNHRQMVRGDREAKTHRERTLQHDKRGNPAHHKSNVRPKNHRNRPLTHRHRNDATNATSGTPCDRNHTTESIERNSPAHHNSIVHPKNHQNRPLTHQHQNDATNATSENPCDRIHTSESIERNGLEGPTKEGDQNEADTSEYDVTRTQELLNLIDRKHVRRQVEVSTPKSVMTEGYGTELYENELHQTWTILAPDHMLVRLELVDLGLEYEENCDYDRLIIRDGATSQAPQLAKLCGEYSAPFHYRYDSTGSSMYLDFRSDITVVDRGFLLDVSFIDPSEYEPLPEASCPDWEYIGGPALSEGTLYSPGYGRFLYPNNQHCTWVFIAEVGEHVRLSFEALAIESSVECQYDSLVLMEEGQVMREYCSSSLPPDYVSTSNMLVVKFDTDANIRWPGFIINYTSVPAYEEVEVTDPCPGPLLIELSASEPKHVIQSPEFITGHYLNDIQCQWDITLLDNDASDFCVQVKFDQVNIEGHAQCQYDALILREDGEPVDGYYLCDYLLELPPVYCSESNSVSLTFHTDWFVRSGWWQVVVERHLRIP